jgi:hypothetical protein
MRARPIVHNWKCSHQFELDTGLLKEDELAKIAAIAGRDIDVGDWRPRYGTFDAQIKNGRGRRVECKKLGALFCLL